jgi:hypothetical protein
MFWKRLVVGSLGLALCLAVAFVARAQFSADWAVPDEVAAQVKGGAAAYCGAYWDYDPTLYACGAPCLADQTQSCLRWMFACNGTAHQADYLTRDFYECVDCTCGSNCGGGTLYTPHGCN